MAATFLSWAPITASEMYFVKITLDFHVVGRRIDAQLGGHFAEQVGGSLLPFHFMLQLNVANSIEAVVSPQAPIINFYV